MPTNLDDLLALPPTEWSEADMFSVVQRGESEQDHEKRQRMAHGVDSYFSHYEAKGLDPTPNETHKQKRALWGALHDDAAWEQTPSVQVATALGADTAEARALEQQIEWLSSEYRQPREEVAAKRGLYAADYALRTWGEAKDTEPAAFVGRIKPMAIEAQQREAKLIEASQLGLEAGAGNVPRLQALRSRAGATAEEVEEFSRAYDRAKSVLDPHRETITQAVPAMQRLEQHEGSEDDRAKVSWLVDAVADMPEGEQDEALRIILASVEKSGTQAGLGGTVMLSAARTLETMYGPGGARLGNETRRELLAGRVATSEPITSAEQASHALQVTQEVIAAKKVHAQGEPIPWREMTAEESKLVAAEVAREGKRDHVARKLQQIAREGVKQSDTPVLGTMAAGLGSSLPLMLAATPSGLVASAGGYAHADYEQLLLEHPEMDRDAATRVALVSGSIQAGIDKAKLWGLGKLPNVRSVITGSATREAIKATAVQAGKVYAFENLQEGFQDLTLPAVQSLATALSADVPGVDWQREMKDFWATRLDVAIGILPLTLIGIGANTAMNRNAVLDTLRSNQNLGAAGIPEQARIKVLELSQKGDAKGAAAALVEAWPRRDPAIAAEWQAVAEENVQTAMAVKADQARRAQDIGVSVGLVGGEWHVRFADGKSIPATSQDAAERIAGDLKQSYDEDSAEANVALLQGIAGIVNRGTGAATDIEIRGESVKYAEGKLTSTLPGRAPVEIKSGAQLDAARRQHESMGFAPDMVAEINGSNEMFRDGVGRAAVKITINRSEGQLMPITAVHEGLEAVLKAKKGWEKDAMNAVSQLAIALEKTHKWQSRNPDFAARLDAAASGQLDSSGLREVVVELAVADLLGRDRQGRKTGMAPGTLSRAIDAELMAGDGDLTGLKRLKVWFAAAKIWLDGVLGVVRAIDKARASGNDLTQWDGFVDGLLGLEENTFVRSVQRASTETVSHSMAGVRSQVPQRMRASLDAAKAMAAAGKASAEIRALTGWFPGRYDGKMRYEVPDSGAMLKSAVAASTSGYSGTLGDALHHPQLLAAYPELAGVKLSLSIDAKRPPKGSFDGVKVDGTLLNSASEFKVSARTYDEAQSVLHHEVQHWIQHREGFARGSSPTNGKVANSRLASLLTLNDARRQAYEKYAAIDTAIELGEDFDAAQYEKAESALLSFPQGQEMLSLHGLLMGGNQGTATPVDLDAYLRTAGEIEARDVQARQSYTPEQLAAVEPYSSENIAAEDAVVLFSDAEDQGVSHSMARTKKALPKRPSGRSIRATPLTEDAKRTVMPDGAVLVGPSTFSITAYHGTPHKVPRFSTRYMGTGEGVQAYGWGLYFAQERRVAQSYRRFHETPEGGVLRNAFSEASKAAQDKQEEVMSAIMAGDDTLFSDVAFLLAGENGEVISLRVAADAAKAAWLDETENSGNLYTVDLLPDEAEFLAWDKPFEQQSEKVQAALLTFISDVGKGMLGMRAYTEAHVAAAKTPGGRSTPQEASEFLLSLGIKGIRFLDGSSRDSGEGTQNFVIFDESLVRILEENGNPVEQAEVSKEDNPDAAQALIDLAREYRIDEGLYLDAALEDGEIDRAVVLRAKALLSKSIQLDGATHSMSAARKVAVAQTRLEVILKDRPQQSAEIVGRIARDLDKLAKRYAGYAEPKTTSELDLEQLELATARLTALEAMYQGEVEAQQYGVHELPMSYMQHPLAEFVLSKRGRMVQGKLMPPGKWRAEKLQDVKEGKLTSIPGDYDGASDLPRWVFAGGMGRPDQVVGLILDAQREGRIAQRVLPDDALAHDLWPAIGKMLDEVANNKALYRSYRERLKEASERAQREAVEEASEWRAERDAEQALLGDTRAQVLRDMAVVTAFMGAVPSEIRASMGSAYRAVAAAATDEAYRAVVTSFVAKLQAALSKHWKEQNFESMRELVMLGQGKTSPGKKPRGTATAAIHDYFSRVAQVVEMTPAQTDGVVGEIEKALNAEDSDLSVDEEAELNERLRIAQQWGAFANLHVDQQAAILAEGWAMYRSGRNAWFEAEQKRLQERREEAASVVLARGQGTYPRLAERQKEERGDDKASWWKTLLRNGAAGLVDFGQFTRRWFGEDHALAAKWEKAERDARLQRDRELTALQHRWRSAQAQAMPSMTHHQRRKRVWEMQTKPSVVVTIQEEENLGRLGRKEREEARAAGLVTLLVPEAMKLTEFQALFVLLTSRQPQYLEGLALAGYGKEKLRQIEAGLSAECRALGAWMSSELANQHPKIDAVMRRVAGIGLPQIPNYFPARFFHAGNEQPVEMGMGMIGQGFQDGFLKQRRAHVAEIKPESALQVFFGHMNTAAHWTAFAEPVRDMRGVLRNTAVKRSLAAQSGRANGMFETWMQALEADGVKHAQEAVGKTVAALSSRFAVAKLSLNVPSAMKNAAEALATSLEVPFGVWLQGARGVWQNPSVYSDIYQSEVIQQRLANQPADVRALLDEFWSAKPGVVQDIMERGMELHGWIDAHAVTVGAAIAYEGYARQAQEGGMSESDSHRFGMEKMAEAVNRTAQPQGVGTRSLTELAASPLARPLLLFGTAMRQKFALWVTAWRHVLGDGMRKAKGEKERKATLKDARVLLLAHLVMAPVMQTLNNIVRDFRDGDDDGDDDKAWEVEDYAVAMFIGYADGLPLFGAALKDMISGRDFGGKGSAFLSPLYAVGGAVGDLIGFMTDGKDNDIEDVGDAALKLIRGIGGPISVGATVVKDAALVVDQLNGDEYDD